jgi:cobalt/nickel transport system permease protein
MQAALPDYPAGDTAWHRLDPRWKLAAVALCGGAVAGLRTAPAAGTALLAALALLGSARLPWRWSLARLGGVAGFLGAVLVLLPLTVPDGWALAGVIAGRALAVVALTLFLLATTPLPDLLQAAHALRVPGVVVQLLLLTYRYVLLLADELGRVRIALRLRGYRNRASAHAYRTIGRVAGTLLVRSFERAERVAQAMRCRGFDGRFRSLHAFRARPADPALAAALVGWAAGLPWGIEVWMRFG